MDNKHLYNILNEYALTVISTYKQKLQSNNKNATHSLERSLNYYIDFDSGNEIKVVLTSEDHIEFVENGRLPTRNGGTGEVQRKIEDWIVAKNIIPHEDERGRIPTIKQLSFLIARKIHTEGYSGTGLLKETVEEVYNQFEDRINEAIEMDVSEFVLMSVDNIINNMFE